MKGTMTLTDHKVCSYIHICIYRHLYRSLLSQSSGFLWNLVESSGMDAFLRNLWGIKKYSNVLEELTLAKQASFMIPTLHRILVMTDQENGQSGS